MNQPQPLLEDDTAVTTDGAPAPVHIKVAAAGVSATDLDAALEEIYLASVAGGVTSVAAGSGITVDSTDPAVPVVAIDTTVVVTSVAAGGGITVDSTDPTAPIVAIRDPRVIATGVVSLVTGTATVANSSALTGSNILLTVQSLGTVIVPTAVGVTARVNATSFTITSADATDTSAVSWAILQ